MNMYCSECKEYINIIDGVTAIWQRGYWWCTKHVEFQYDNIVAFPSRGMMIPRTICTEK